MEPIWDDVHEALDRAAARDVAGLSDAALAEDLIALQQLCNRVNAEMSRTLAAFDARGGALADGAASTQAWLRHKLLVSPSTAAGRVALARQFREGGALADASSAGDLS